jgi:hypothetical protein
MQLRKYKDEHPGLLCVKREVRCRTKKDARSWGGQHFPYGGIIYHYLNATKLSLIKLCQLNFSDFFEWSRVKSTRANHAYKLCVKASRVNCYKYSFFVRTIGLWNALPKYVLEANNFSAFKKALKDYLIIKDLIYSYICNCNLISNF